ncbi:MAG: ABC transporter permease [Alphaproteobacteria bacterium]|mgnify:CR=1 FL=1|jgi:ribose/xylose/arabinose/galactoside ABC-type transport system permease subunit|tara:strand:+ start:1414 stop:2364 length:951 start_codon:yes stop_codon:yes gene_type:complete
MLKKNYKNIFFSNSLTIPIIICLISAITFSITVPNFSDLRNILNIFEQMGVLGFLAIGMTFVMISGGIDLSSYTAVSAAAVVGATIMVATESALLGSSVMLLVGLFFGTINGIAIAYLKMIPFIVTLSTMVLAQGFAIWFTKAQSVYGLPDSLIDLITDRLFGYMPMPAILIFIVAIISGFILRYTKMGRELYLTGSNEHTAEISNINIKSSKFSVYLVSGLMAGITAIVLSGIVETSTTSMVRDERLMDVIAATVIGGASLKGGSGSIIGTLFGLLFLTMLGNAFNLLGVSPFIAMVIKGFVLVAVIGLDVLRTK